MNVFQRIATDGDDVGSLAWRQKSRGFLSHPSSFAALSVPAFIESMPLMPPHLTSAANLDALGFRR